MAWPTIQVIRNFGTVVEAPSITDAAAAGRHAAKQEMTDLNVRAGTSWMPASSAVAKMGNIG